MAKYVLGLDAGNTVIKAVLFDLSGNQIAIAQENGASLSPQPGYVERDMDELWQQAGVAISSCIKQSNVDAGDIVAIGCAGHGNGLYLLGHEGEALLAIQSLDNRAASVSEALSVDGNADLLQSICLQRPWPSQTPTLLAWVKQNNPELFAKTGTAFLCKDFINFKLTGNISSDVTDMSGCGFLKMPENEYSTQLMAAYDLSDAMDKLPQLFGSTEIVGTVDSEAAEHTGLRIGTPVLGGVFDVVASALGSGTIETGQASIIAGTWSINQIIVEEPKADTDIFMASAYDGDRFVEIEASATSAVNLEWFVHGFMRKEAEQLKDSGKSIFDLCNEMVVSVSEDINLPVFHPYVYGGATSGLSRGGFYGLSGWHGQPEMLYALFEGVVFGHCQHINKLKENGIQIGNVILSGGGSRSPIWPQMFADILGVEVSVAVEQETGALGAAISAAIGTGHHQNHKEAVGNMTSISKTFMPDVSKAHFYRQRIHLFNRISDQIEAVWSDLENETKHSQ